MSFGMLPWRLVIRLLRVVGEDDRALAPVGELNARRSQVKRADHRLAGVGAHLGQDGLQSLACGSETAERVFDGRAPVRTGDDLADYAARRREPGEPGLVQPESEFDDIGDAVTVDALPAFILEGLGGAAGGEEARLEVLGADDAEMPRSDRLAVLLHGCQQPGDAVAVDPVGAEKVRQRLMRAADLGEDPALARGPAEPAEFADECPHGAAFAEIAVSGDMRGEIAL